ncbi:uncharacterized protein LOC130900227 isoform X1 [Diorhabda carinulata]|uniref:uncharacterized protein LOC130900227 isoform X1 n=1 Tax=Diorhabda carinulata TaxID=1163345 RepID=UPI0025A20AB2|nr:uncharacterized protein LOC130900227 isoform X1 [Diorhabda carinulata]
MDNFGEINNENESENLNECHGYYTRSKRRKLEKDDETYTMFPDYNRKRKNPITFLPLEVIQAVFNHLSYHELSKTVRLVNHRFKIIAEDILNRSFKQLEKKINVLILTTEKSLQCTDDEMEIKCVVKLLNMLEILKLQCSVVVATVWRYIYNDYYKPSRSCFYAGQLLDGLNDFIYKFFYCPYILYAPAIIKDHAFPQEMTNIIVMIKNFCLHFDRVIEEPLPDCTVCSGCKMIDILDCAQFSSKSVVSEKADVNGFSAEYNYFFRNSWFVALPMLTNRNMEQSEKQRFMHMRLRRIVLAHTDMFLQQSHYEREELLRPYSDISPPKKPSNNVYTGYGDTGKIFFYYGCMNDGAYNQKFHDDQIEEDSDEEPPNDQLHARNSEENILYRIPHLGFNVQIKVQCPLKYAPLRFLEKCKDALSQNLEDDKEVKTHLKLIFECQGASYTRLPTRFEYTH